MKTKVFTIVFEEEEGNKRVKYYGDMTAKEALQLLMDIVITEAQNSAVESYKKEAKDGSNLP